MATRSLWALVICGRLRAVLIINHAIQMIFHFPDFQSRAGLARCYPEGFVRRLMALWEGRREIPMQHLRHRPSVDPLKSDRELFASLPLGDPWVESGIHHVFKYLWNCKYVSIPDSWLDTMKQFNAELTQVVPRLFFVFLIQSQNVSVIHTSWIYRASHLVNPPQHQQPLPRYVCLKRTGSTTTWMCNRHTVQH